MGFFSDHHERNEQAYDQVYNQPEQNKASWSHELIGGGAAAFAMHEYEKREESQGEQVNHAFAKELLAGIAGAEVDRLAETKGLDFLDREKAKHHAKKEAEKMYEAQYEN